MPLRALTTLLSLILLFPGYLFGQTTAPWKRLDKDLEISEIPVPSKRFFRSSLVLLRSSLSRYRIGVVRASEYGEKVSDVKELCRKSNAVAGVNANFFDEDGRALGLVISRGLLLQKMHEGGHTLTGVFLVTRSSGSIVSRSEFRPNSVIEAVQAGPRLLIGGVPVTNLKDLNIPKRRAGVCIDSGGRTILYATSSSLGGATLGEVQSVLVGEPVECRDALNLDGGGSAQMYVNAGRGASLNTGSTGITISGEDPVPVMLGLFERE